MAVPDPLAPAARRHRTARPGARRARRPDRSDRDGGEAGGPAEGRRLTDRGSIVRGVFLQLGFQLPRAGQAAAVSRGSDSTSLALGRAVRVVCMREIRLE